MDRNQIFILLNAAVSVVLVAFLLHLVGLQEVLVQLAGMDFFLLFLSILCLFGMDVVMAFRIKLLLDDMKAGIRFADILRSHFVGMLLADFTPSRTGYFATVAALRYNYGVPSDKALLSIFGPQMFDFIFKVVAGSVAILYIIFVFIGPGQGLVLIAGAFVITAIVVLMLLILFSKRFLALFSFARGLPVVSRLYDVVVRMQDSSHVVVRKTPHILFLIMVSWVFRSLSWYFAAKSVGITLGTGIPGSRILLLPPAPRHHARIRAEPDDSGPWPERKRHHARLLAFWHRGRSGRDIRPDSPVQEHPAPPSGRPGSAEGPARD